MWGNLQGWIISACIVLLTLIVGARMRSWTQITDATDFSTGENLAVIAPPISAGIVDQAEAGDAGKLYRGAIAQYKKNALDAYMRDPTGTPPTSIELVLNATHKTDATIFGDTPGELINYKNDHESLATLKEIGDMALKTGMVLMGKNEKAEAKRYLEASFALGWDLYRERLTHEEYMDGNALMENAIQELAALAGSSDEGTKRTDDLKNLQNYNRSHVEPIYQTLANINSGEINFHAGDFYRFAHDSKDRMVQDEAILSIGRLRFNAARNADQDSALKVVSKYADSADPYVSTAGKAARDLTLPEYNMSHP